MLRYTKKDILSVRFKKDIGEIEHYDDIFTEVLHHLSYVGDVNLLEFEMLQPKTYIIECDYCGKLIKKRKTGGNNNRILTNKYIDEEAEYPCTDNCCTQCIGKKNQIVWLEKHGVVKNINALKTMEKLGKVPTSRQQVYLSRLLNGIHNKYIKGIGYADIVLEEDKIIVEYDGSGHYAGVRFGRYTYEEKLEQDYERDLNMRSLGYKIIRIESENDYLPSDEVILAKINEIKEYFNTSGKEFFKWVIPKSKKDKRYGKLRKITKEDIDNDENQVS